MKTATILKKFGVRPVKRLGQNFLADHAIAQKIIDESFVDRNSCVVEIGPGVGSLTVGLAERAGIVIAVEIDRKLADITRSVTADYDNVAVLNGDILSMDIEELFNAYGRSGMVRKVVSNLPYCITTPVIIKLVEESASLDSITVMVQKEVADRLTAQPGSRDYGALTVSVGYYTQPEKLIDVSPGCFIPRPDVWSAVIRLDLSGEPVVTSADRGEFVKTVRAAFGQRRKKLKNALFNCGYFSMTREQVGDILKNTGIDPDCRGETLSVMQFEKLANSLFAQQR